MLCEVAVCDCDPAFALLQAVSELAASAEIQIKILPCRVSEMHRLAHDVMLLKLKLPASQRFDYLAGQYLDILLRDGRRRSFSMASRPQPGQELELHIRHVPGGSFIAGGDPEVNETSPTVHPSTSRSS